MANVRELKANNTVYDIIGKGVADQHNMSGNPLKLWTGTYAEYSALQTTDADTLYILTDETIPAKVQTIFDFKWADHIIDDPSSLLFWFDFFESEKLGLGQFSVPAIGTRPKNKNNDKVRALIYKDVPDIIFVS